MQMAVERGYTVQGEMFSGELGAEGSQVWPSSPGTDWRGWVRHGQVCGRTFFPSSGPSPHPVLQGRLWSKAVWVPSPTLPLPTMWPWTLILSVLFMVTVSIRGINPQGSLDSEKHRAIPCSVCALSLQWPTWADWLRRHWAAKLSSSVGVWVVPTEAVCCSTLSLDIPCSSRIPGQEGNRVGWISLGPGATPQLWP